MQNKELKFGFDARMSMLNGIQKLEHAVVTTLGPRGKTVIIEGPDENSKPLITKDGVSVSNSIKFKDHYENLGVELVKSAASKMNSQSGDGTTTATLIATRTFSEGLTHVTAGNNPTLIKRGIDKAVCAVVARLKEVAIPVTTKDEIKQVATISANGDDVIGEIISNAMDAVGKDGTILLEKGRGVDTSLRIIEGMQFSRGYLSSHFITNMSTSEAILVNPMILLYENKLTSVQSVLPFLQKITKVQKENNRPLLIIADDIEPEVLTTLVVNKIRGSLNICVIKSPFFGADKTAMLEDMAIFTGATLVGETIGKKIENVELSDLGSAKKVIVGREVTTIVEGLGEPQSIKDRVSHLQNLLNSDAGYDVVKLRDRISKLSGGICVVDVGGNSESEMQEKYHRVEDALHATRAAVAEGIIAGGGVALLRCISALDGNLGLSGNESLGVDIVRRVLSAPITQIVNNSGLGDGSVVAAKVLENDGNFGYDALTGEYCDMIERGIIDPVKVCRCAIQNGTGVASLLLTTDCCIVNE